MTGLIPYLLAAGGAVVALLIAYIKGGMDTARKAEAKQTADKLRAAEDRLEMDREATEAERKASGMTDEEARREAMKWAKC